MFTNARNTEKFHWVIFGEKEQRDACVVPCFSEDFTTEIKLQQQSGLCSLIQKEREDKAAVNYVRMRMCAVCCTIILSTEHPKRVEEYNLDSPFRIIRYHLFTSWRLHISLSLILSPSSLRLSSPNHNPYSKALSWWIKQTNWPIRETNRDELRKSRVKEDHYVNKTYCHMDVIINHNWIFCDINLFLNLRKFHLDSKELEKRNIIL